MSLLKACVLIKKEKRFSIMDAWIVPLLPVGVLVPAGLLVLNDASLFDPFVEM
jgi:hypothetical protein